MATWWRHDAAAREPQLQRRAVPRRAGQFKRLWRLRLLWPQGRRVVERKGSVLALYYLPLVLGWGLGL